MAAPVTEQSPPPTAAPAKPQVSLVLFTVLIMFGSQMILNPIIAPLSREVGLAEWQVGLMVSTAALTLVITSQFWGRKSLSWGRKPVLVTATIVGGVAMASFAGLAWLGITGVLSGVALFVLMVLTRGLLFGSAMSAVVPTSQAYIADVTPTESERVKGMAGVGAMQGIAMVVGSSVGGLLAGFGLMVPLALIPGVIVIGSIVLATRLRRETRHELIPNPPRIRPNDSRVWPFLVAGLGMFTALGFIQIVTGFLIQDRYAPQPETAALYTGVALLCAGVGTILSQTIIVRRFNWPPVRLLRTGTAVAVAGFILMIPDVSLILFIPAIFLVGLGLGMATPGYIAGPSLLMSKAEQGGMAGLISANNGLTFVIAPTLATALYEWWSPLPIFVSVVAMSSVVVFLWTHPRFRTMATSTPEPVKVTTSAS
ncbi:putative MFS family arabinose efflux permease [Stackebrandtia endophytica]|uniref:Putative MFS family arabinose efflux permease n=1 Tax=Stackebrandtia endophytica TaxID=1496996 RepID=A0A543ASN0_9ACTN|nr:MFS transporter [Stackebrandtia endophytica]TQL75589.1 putative MFS family arabinose efflux permease [Stackebrandtia endophytica]